MKDDRDPTGAPTYLQRLGVPAFSFDEVLARHPRAKPFHLMVLALLEHGGPLTLDEIVGRLLRAGVVDERAEAWRLQKSWHGLKPVYKGPDDRCGLLFEGHELRGIAHDLGLYPRVAVEAVPARSPVPDDVPLDLAEVEAAYRGANLNSLSAKRQAAALLDAHGGGPLTIAAIEAALAALTPYRVPLTSATVAAWQGDLIVRELAGLRLNLASPELAAMRRDLRKRSGPALEEAERRARFAAGARVREAEREAARRSEEATFAGYRRALVHAVPDPTQVEAATVLDLVSRTFTYFGPGEIERLAQHLAGYQVLVGLHVRDMAIALGLDPEARTIVDLKPPQRSVVVNKRGKKLKITPELLVSGTTGIGSPLADPAKVAEYLATGDDQKLARRLASDAKAGVPQQSALT